jgi:hypothetical protein
MALLAESLVEEWLNRLGFFTIRGIKHGINEVDLLGVHKEADGSIVGRHVEVQVSFRPVGYIAKLTDDLAGAGEKRRSRSSAMARTPEQVELCARAWVWAKYRCDAKVRVREQLWPGATWSFDLVHAVVREPQELTVFQRENVHCHSFWDVISELLQSGKGGFSGSSGGDLAEIIKYYKKATAKGETGLV